MTNKNIFSLIIFSMMILVLFSTNISAIGIGDFGEYCGDGICTTDAEYNESNIASDFYCAYDCMTMEDMCLGIFLEDPAMLEEACSSIGYVADSDCPDCPTCTGASYCSISSITPTQLNEWCVSNDYSKAQTNTSSSDGNNNSIIFFIIFLIVGFIVGYNYKKKKRGRK